MKKSQTTLEAMLVLILVVFALGTTLIGHFRRSLQGNWRSNIDNFSEGQYQKGVYDDGGRDGSAITFSGTSITAEIGSSGGGGVGVSVSGGEVRIPGWGSW